MSLILKVLMSVVVLVSIFKPVYASNGSSSAPGSPSVEAIQLPGTVPVKASSPDPSAPNAAAWYDGQIVYSSIINCVSIIQGLPYSENGIGVYTGFWADPDLAQPGVNQVYYAHVVLYGLGNACSGQRAYLDIQLPASTVLAISVSNPLKCYSNGGQFTNGCPQSLPASSVNPGAYQILSNDTAHALTWPMPQGGFWEFQVPLISSATLTNSTFQANVWSLDGNSSPWLRPTQGIYVFSNTPAVLYPTPSTEITVGPPPYYKSQAYIYTFGLGGTVYFDLGTSYGSYGLVTDSAPILAGQTAYLAWDDWLPFALTPNTTYHWRVRFVASNAQTYTGVDQTFTTLPDGQATVGSGAPGGCTPAAFDSALATPGLKTLTFNCGNAPLTINLSGQKTITTDLTIDGGHYITLNAGNSFRHFDLAGGATLTLKNITLSNGSASGCGGAVRVQASATLNTYGVLMTGNHATGSGGALCVESGGQAIITSSQLAGNSASVDGGGVYNLGSADFMWSDISGNSAQNNGGGAWNSGSIGFLTSLIANNTLPTGTGTRGTQEGGGLYNIGDASLGTSSVAGNTASFSAGIYNLNASLFLTGVTVAYNTAAAGGKPLFTNAQAGGLDSNGTGSSTLRNTLIANNAPGNCGESSTKTVVSMGHNLDSGMQCNFTQGSDKPGVNPMLAQLANNGGTSRTLALQYGSPAIDTADDVYCGFYDQRGFSGPTPQGSQTLVRAVDGNRDGVAVCDIGAFEFVYTPQVFIPTVRR